VLVLAAALLGALIGLGSTLGTTPGQEGEPTRFEATHTLISDAGNTELVVLPNLPQIAFRVTAGRVTRQAAASLDFRGDPRDLAQQITSSADLELQSIRITAVDEHADRAVELADTFAAELLAVLTPRAPPAGGR
jgi:glucokinase